MWDCEIEGWGGWQLCSPVLLSFPIDAVALGLRLMGGVVEVKVCDEEMKVKVMQVGARMMRFRTLEFSCLSLNHRNLRKYQ